MNTPSIISAVGLTKVFRDFWRRARVKAVNSVDLEIQPGEIFGLLGPNGSGKSTTIKLILGLLHPTRGRVAVFGRPPDDVRSKSRIGYLPEESYLYRFLNARETLDYYGTLFRIPRGERRRRTEGLLEMVGLRSAARRAVGEYSKGMARRIGLAQALVNDPDLLILDEPTSGLDPIGAKLVKDIIVRLGQQHRKTILLSSHLLADVEEVCDRVTILYGGREQVSGRISEVLAHRDKTQILCDRLSPETIAAVTDLVQRQEGKTLEVSTPRDRLETLFLRIVREAHAHKVETAGSAVAGEIASFLGESEQGKAVLESLTKVEPVETGPAEPEPVPSGTDATLLGELVAPPPAPKPAAGPAVPAPPPRGDVDRTVLDELTEDEGGGGGA
ncbi:MAG: ABC transporter ATP-binding protein [Phycisphaerae bacterium]